MTHYKYRIQVGDEYTYRSSMYAMDLLVRSLLDGSSGLEDDIEGLLAKARGKDVSELAPRRPPVRAEDIWISVVVEPPERRPEEGRHKVGEPLTVG